eukprot:9714530-Heterocapsa_arctica.AAC.1
MSQGLGHVCSLPLPKSNPLGLAQGLESLSACGRVRGQKRSRPGSQLVGSDTTATTSTSSPRAAANICEDKRALWLETQHGSEADRRQGLLLLREVRRG